MIKENALKYLGYQKQELSDDFYALLDECEKEVKRYSYFKATHKLFHLDDEFNIIELNISIKFNDTKVYLKGCHSIIILAGTLGIALERRLKYIQKIDMTKAVVMDAISNSYLEYLMDEYEKKLNLEKRTFRFAPGYGDVPLSLNVTFSKVLDVHKNIGLTYTKGGLFLPQKSMLGFIGVGKQSLKKHCGNCIKKESCSLRKENKRCWID